MKNTLTILNVKRRQPGERFLVQTENIVAELEVAQPDRGVVLIASNQRKRRYHRPIPELRVGGQFLGERITRIKRMKARDE